MAGIYRERHPEHSVFYRVLFYSFERFLQEYEDRFEKEYGFFRPVIQDVVEKYLDCGNPMCGFARIRCPDCGEERLLMFSCKTRGFCPSCHAKRCEEWGEWMREELLLDVAHRQVFFTIPKMLRIFFKYNRSLLSGLCLHFLVSEGGSDREGRFHSVCRFNTESTAQIQSIWIIWSLSPESPPIFQIRAR